MNIWDLPTSVFEGKVLSSLSVRDLASLGQVSKQFRDEVQADSVWEAIYHHHYGPRTPLLKRAAEIAGGYRQLCRSRLLSDKASGPGVHRATEAEEAAFVESVIWSGGWTRGAEGVRGTEADEGPAGIIFLIIELCTKIVSAALLKNLACLTAAIQFQRFASTAVPLQSRTAQAFKSSLSDLFYKYYAGHAEQVICSCVIHDAYDPDLECGANMGPAMDLAREEFEWTELPLPLDAPKCVIVISDGLWSPDEVAEAQAAAAELCRGDLGPVRVFGVGVGWAARMDEFRGMLEAQGSLPPQASARYLTLLSNRKPFTLDYDLTCFDGDESLECMSDADWPLGLEFDDKAPPGSLGARWSPPPAWLVARLPSHRLRVILEAPQIGTSWTIRNFRFFLGLAPWVESIRVMPGGPILPPNMLFSLPYSQKEVKSFSNLRELSLYKPDSVPALPRLTSLKLYGPLGALDLYSQFKGLSSLKELKICAWNVENTGLGIEAGIVQDVYGAMTTFDQLERLTLILSGPVWILPDVSFCCQTLKSFSFTYFDSFDGPSKRQRLRQGWLAQAEGTTNLITVSDVAAALSDCASLESLELEVVSAEGLEGIEQLMAFPRLRRLALACSMPRAEMEGVRDRCLEPFSALKQVVSILLYEALEDLVEDYEVPLCDWRCEYSWEEGTLAVKTIRNERPRA